MAEIDLSEYASAALRILATSLELMRRVCDQDGGAHMDPKARAGLQGVDSAAGWIYKIGAEAQQALEKTNSVR